MWRAVVHSVSFGAETGNIDYDHQAGPGICGPTTVTYKCVYAVCCILSRLLYYIPILSVYMFSANDPLSAKKQVLTLLPPNPPTIDC